MGFAEIYRHSLFSVLIVAWGAFCLPGAFGALNGLGAAGLVDATVSNAANAIVFGVLAVGAFVAGPLVNFLGVKLSFILGTVGYAPYAASFLLNKRTGNNWFVIFGSVLLGLSAFLLWTSTAAVFLGYPEERHKGRAISAKFYFQHIGGSLGGVITLALNTGGSRRGAVSDATYIAFITIMCLALPASFLLSPPDKVVRSDGTKPQAVPFSSWQIGPAVGGALTGVFFDAKRFTRQQKARIAAMFLVVFSVGTWTFGLVVQYQYDRRPATAVIDWSDPAFAKSLVLFILYGLLENSNVLLIYFLIGTFTSDVNRLTSYAGLVNGIGSIGTVVAFVLGAVGVNLKGQLWANVACFLAAAPGLLYVAWNVTELPEQLFPSSPTLGPGSLDGDNEEKIKSGAVLPQLST